jgi:hypothetical protein
VGKWPGAASPRPSDFSRYRRLHGRALLDSNAHQMTEQSDNLLAIAVDKGGLVTGENTTNSQRR